MSSSAHLRKRANAISSMLMAAALISVFAGCSNAAGNPPAISTQQAVGGQRAASSRVPATNCGPIPLAPGDILGDGDFHTVPSPTGGDQTYVAGTTIDSAAHWRVTGFSIDVVDSTYWPTPSNGCTVDLDGSPGDGGIKRKFTAVPGLYYVQFTWSGSSRGGINYMRVSGVGATRSYQWDTSGNNDVYHGVYQTRCFSDTLNGKHHHLLFRSYDNPDKPGNVDGPVVTAIAVTATPITPCS